MWVFTKSGMISILSHDDPTKVLVAARLREDLRRTLGPLLQRLKLKIYYHPTRDHAYRCEIPRADLAQEISNQILEINYNNFMDSIKAQDPEISRTKYLCRAVWYACLNAQEREQEIRDEAILWDPTDRNEKP